jgi:hypothetical protein
MAEREGSWWSRGWGTVAVLAFAIYLGASVYEAAVIAPLWTLEPPASVTAWVALKTKPDPSMLYQALTAILIVSTAMAWISGISERGWRRWWLTLALTCAGSIVAIHVTFLTPIEDTLFGAGARNEKDAAQLLALTGDWVRAAAMRMAALLIGAWAAYRAQLAGMLGRAYSPAGAGVWDDAPAREFSLGDEPGEEISLGDDGNPRQRWMGSLPAGRRTAKK